MDLDWTDKNNTHYVLENHVIQKLRMSIKCHKSFFHILINRKKLYSWYLSFKSTFSWLCFTWSNSVVMLVHMIHVDISMTSLFAHKVAQPTKWRFLLKNLNQLVIFVIGLAFTWSWVGKNRAQFQETNYFKKLSYQKMVLL